jgi:hypothetical protein
MNQRLTDIRRAQLDQLLSGGTNMAGGGLLKAAAKAVKAAKPTLKAVQDVLPAAEREANLAKFMEGSVAPKLYHGTVVRPDTEKVKSMGDIHEFNREFTTKFRKPSLDTLGNWFSDNPGKGGAEMYSGAHEGSAIYPAHVSIKNPHETTFELMQRRARLLANGKDDGRQIGKAEVDAYRKWLKDMGKDGVVVTDNPGTSSGSTEFQNQNAYIALEPEQIKSAIGNRGTYDITDPDINKAGGGLLKAAVKAAKPAAKAVEKTAELALKIKPPSDNIRIVRESNFMHSRPVGNQTVKIGDLSGGVRLSDPQEKQRVKELADKISSPDGYISRIIVDQDNNVIEGQHRLEALRQLGVQDVPVYKIEDLEATMPVDKMKSAMSAVGPIHSDHVNQLIDHALEHISEGGMDNARQMNYGKFQKHYDAALDAAEQPNVKALESAPQEEALRLAQQRAALSPAKGGLGLAANNTPEQRAAAMGINTDAYHGTKQDIKGAFVPGYNDDLAFVTKDPDFASKWVGKGKMQKRVGAEAEQKSAEDLYRALKHKHMDFESLDRDDPNFHAEYDKRNNAFKEAFAKEAGLDPDRTHSAVYPMKVEANNTFNPETDMDVMAEYFAKNNTPQEIIKHFQHGNYLVYENQPVVDFLKSKGYDSMRLRESTDDNFPTIAVFNPETIRSRFAAFDPFRKTAATAAVMGVAAPDLLAKEQEKAQGGLVHLAGGGDPRKRGLFPKMSMQAIVDSPGFDPEVPSDLSRAYARRMAEKDAYQRSMADQKLTPSQRAVAGAEATGMIGSALFEGVQQLPKLLDGEEAYTKAVGEGMYKPRFQPEKAAEYAGNVGDFLERLETEYKMPALTPELMPFIGAAEAAKQQSKRAVKQGALTAASRMDAGPKAGSLAAQRGVIKMPGGNWLGGNVEKAVEPLKRKTAGGMTPESALAQMKERFSNVPGQEQNIRRLEGDVALNQWLERNLSNYVKKQMGTANDPVRKLAEEGILHIPSEQVGVNRYRAPKHREAYGGEQLGKSEAAKAWEDASDVAINAPTAKTIKTNEFLYQANPWIEKLPNEERVFTLSNPAPNPVGMAANLQPIHGLGFDHIMDVLRADLAEGRIRPEQLNKVSMEQAVRRTYEYDQEMAKKMRETQAKVTEGMPVHKEYPEGYKWIELTAPKDLPEGWSAEGNNLINPNGGRPGQAGDSSDPRYKTLETALKYEGDTMGHCVGGYCPDVLAGRSRIYSLRDAKGEPHVTVEVKPLHRYSSDETDKLSNWFTSQPEALQNEITQEAIAAHEAAKQANTSKENRYYWGMAMNDAIRNRVGEIPPKIVQIKGKGNRAPKEDYLPFVQDFVKGGNWSDVGDLRNTGLRATSDAFNETEQAFLKSKGVELKPYIDPEETARYQELFKQTPPAEGMASGGSVGLKNALNNLLRTDKPEVHMQVGGATKAALKAAKAAGKAAKAAEYLPGVHYADPLKMPTMKMSEALGNAGAEGKTLNFTETDRSRVFGPNRGGAGFSGLQHYSLPHKEANTVWGFGNKTTAEKKIRQNDPENTIWTTYAGSPNQHKSNTIVVKDALSQLQSADSQGLVNPKQIEFINKRIREAVGQNGNPLFPKDFDITDPKAFDYATTFDRRAAISDALMGIGVKKPMISKEFKAANPGVKWSDAANIDAILRRETDPAMLDANTFDVGPHLFVMDNGVIERPDLNEAFPYQVTGTDLGLRYELAPMRAAAPDWIKARNIKPDEPINAWAMSRAAPSQFVSEAYLTSLQKQGKKKGGLAQTKKVKRHGNTVPH